MKKFTKIKSKKGFTLLETLLATAILVIIGSMLMEGFITAMGYSYNSSVYARSASYNSALCIQQLSKWTMLAENKKGLKADGTYNEEKKAYKDVGNYAYNDPVTNYYSSPQTLKFGGGTGGSSLGKIRVAVYEKKAIDSAASINTLNSLRQTEIMQTTASSFSIIRR